MIAKFESITAQIFSRFPAKITLQFQDFWRDKSRYKTAHFNISGVLFSSD